MAFKRKDVKAQKQLGVKAEERNSVRAYMPFGH